MDITTYKEILKSVNSDYNIVLDYLHVGLLKSMRDFGMDDDSANKILKTFLMLACTSKYIKNMLVEDNMDVVVIELVYRHDIERFDINIKYKAKSGDYNQFFYGDKVDYFKNKQYFPNEDVFQILLKALSDDDVFFKSLFNIKKYFLEIDNNKDSEIKKNDGLVVIISFGKTYGGSVICTPQFVKYENETLLYKQVEKYFDRDFERIVLKMDRKILLKKHYEGLRI